MADKVVMQEASTRWCHAAAVGERHALELHVSLVL